MKKLHDRILKASEKIHTASTKGIANYMVVSPSVAQMIQDSYNEYKSGFRKDKIKKLFPDE